MPSNTISTKTVGDLNTLTVDMLGLLDKSMCNQIRLGHLHAVYDSVIYPMRYEVHWGRENHHRRTRLILFLMA